MRTRSKGGVVCSFSGLALAMFIAPGLTGAMGCSSSGGRADNDSKVNRKGEAIDVPVGTGPMAPKVNVPAPKLVERAYKFLKFADKNLPKYNTCVADGGSAASCATTIVLCEIRDKLKSGLPGGGAFGDVLGAFNTVTCDPECFHCCAAPDGNHDNERGCHTSFDATEQPQINCGLGIWVGYIDQGPALLENASPGDWCMTVQHDCTIYPKCQPEPDNVSSDDGGTGSTDPANPPTPGTSSSGGSSVNPLGAGSQLPNGCVSMDWALTGMNAAVDPRLTDDLAVDHRAVRFMQGVDSALRDAFNAGTPGFSDEEVLDFLTHRGMAGWTQFMNSADGFSGRFPNIPVTEADGTFSYAGSMQQAYRVAGISALVHSVPNLYGRLKFVESHVWNSDGIQAYLQFTPDPDAELLKTMSPFALSILKAQKTLQDYRLLAVPTCDETPPSTPLVTGVAPVASLASIDTCDSAKSGLVTLSLNLSCPSGATDCTTAGAIPVSINWGDGHSSTYSQNITTSAVASYTHDYASPGKYKVVATVFGESGLRTASETVVAVKTAPGTAAASTAVLTPLTDVSFEDVKIYSIDSDAGMASFRVGLSTADGENITLGSKSHAINPTIADANAPDVTFVSPDATDPNRFAQGYTISVGDLTGTNDRGTIAKKIVLWPNRTLSNSPYNPITFRFERLTVGVTDPATGTVVHHTIPFSPDLVHVFLSQQKQPLIASQMSAGMDGKGNSATDPWFLLHRWDGAAQSGEAVDRVEIDITPALIAGLPTTAETRAAGTSVMYTETAPGSFTQVAAASALVTVNKSCHTTVTPPFGPNSSIGIFKDGLWYVRDLNVNAPADDQVFAFQEISSDTNRPKPVIGDWNGTGYKRVGTARNRSWVINRSDQTQNFEFTRSITLGWGDGNDVPITGKWLGDGRDYTGVYNTAHNEFTLNALDYGYVSGWGYDFTLGQPGDVPVVGNWTGGRHDGVGLFRVSTGEFILDERDHDTRGEALDTGATTQFKFGKPNDVPVIGRWLGDGKSYVGIYRPSNGDWSLAKSNAVGAAAYNFKFGQVGDVPVVIDLYGDGHDHVALYRPSTGEWFIAKTMGKFDTATTLKVNGFGGPGYTAFAGFSSNAIGYSASWPGPESTTKELPDNGATQPLGNPGMPNWLDMTGNILLMHFDEPSSTAATLGAGFDVRDASGNANHGTMVQNVYFDYPIYNSAGQINEGLKFGGKFIGVAAKPQFDLTSSMTIAAWVRVDQLDMDRAIAVKTDADWTTGYGLYASQSNGLCAFLGNRWTKACATDFAVTNTFRHVVMTYDGASLNVYVDGALKSTAVTTTGATTNTEPFTIGSEQDSINYNLIGNVDEVAVWSRPLSDVEVKAIYDRQK